MAQSVGPKVLGFFSSLKMGLLFEALSIMLCL
jgi:hypothetical protein